MNIKKILIGAGAAATIFGLSAVGAFADTYSANFESPTFTTGNINGQDGWSKTGAYDVAVATNSYGFSSFGTQSLRLSDSVTSGSFGDQTFSKSLTQPAGESNALDLSNNTGTWQRHFETQ